MAPVRPAPSTRTGVKKSVRFAESSDVTTDDGHIEKPISSSHDLLDLFKIQAQAEGSTTMDSPRIPTFDWARWNREERELPRKREKAYIERRKRNKKRKRLMLLTGYDPVVPRVRRQFEEKLKSYREQGSLRDNFDFAILVYLKTDMLHSVPRPYIQCLNDLNPIEILKQQDTETDVSAPIMKRLGTKVFVRICFRTKERMETALKRFEKGVFQMEDDEAKAVKYRLSDEEQLMGDMMSLDLLSEEQQLAGDKMSLDL